MDWPLPHLLHQGLPTLSCVGRASSIFGSVSRAGGLQPTACHVSQKMSQTQIWPRRVQGDLLRQIHLPPTDRWTGPGPFCEHCYILSPVQRPGTHGQTAGEASNPIRFLTLPPPPAPLISLHPGIEWPYKNVQRERQIQKLEKHYPDGGPLTPSPKAPPYLPPAPSPGRAENLWAVSPVFLC